MKVWFGIVLFVLSSSVLAQAKDYWADLSDVELFEMVCNTCHSTALPKQQRLNREHWEWVISDMINDQGCNFLPDKHMQRILDYLVENYGPNRDAGRSKY